MAKGEATVEELVGMIERGELRLPEMQRQYVWKSTRVRDLLDSLYRGYPSGAILLWETDEDVPERAFAVGQDNSPFRTTRLLLDGQQRLTSLSSVIRGEPVQVRGRKRPIEILFNLEHPDTAPIVTEVDEDEDDDDDSSPEGGDDSDEDEILERLERMAFVVSTKKLEQRPNWVKVTDVFKNDADVEFLQKAGVENFSDPRFVRYSQRLARLRAIRKYTYRMDVLERALSYEEVTEIFVRVNSLGAKLRSSDLALAQITAKWRGSLQVFQAFQSHCAKSGFDLDLGLHLKNLVAFATGQSRFHSVASLGAAKLQQAWATCKPAMEFALNFMRSNVKIDSEALLSSPFILVTVAMYAHNRGFKLTEDEELSLRRWVLLANAKARYSRGSSETFLDQDISVIRQGGGPAELTDRLRAQVGHLQVQPGELEGRNPRSALFKTMFLAFREAGACDWETKIVLSQTHTGSQHWLEFHHIFPKALLRGALSAREIDDIANLAFIGAKTNKIISDNPPAKYVPRFVTAGGESMFRKQCVPLSPELLVEGAYKDFLAERRRLIASRLNEFLGQSE